MGSLAATADFLLAQAGESYTLKPRRVGELVRGLGLRTEKLGNQGRGLRLTLAKREKVHQLAQRLGLKATDFLSWDDEDARWGGRACGLCEEYRLVGGLIASRRSWKRQMQSSTSFVARGLPESRLLRRYPMNNSSSVIRPSRSRLRNMVNVVNIAIEQVRRLLPIRQ
jgi:hypothetical protein